MSREKAYIVNGLTKTQVADRDRLVAALRQRAGELAGAVEWFNTRLDKEAADVRAALDAYNDAVRAANEFRAGVVTEANDHYSSRSERWQKSEHGRRCAAFIEEWEDKIGEVEVEVEVDLPDPIDSPVCEAADALEDLPESP